MCINLNKVKFQVLDREDRGSAKPKMWLSIKGKEVLFKNCVKYKGSKYNYSHLSEYIYYMLGNYINVEVAKIELATITIEDIDYIGILSYKVNDAEENLTTAKAELSGYFDVNSEYTFENVYNTFKRYYSNEISNSFMFLNLFDCLVAEVDRHCENVAFVADSQQNVVKLSPIYDSSNNLLFKYFDMNNNKKQKIDKCIEKSELDKTYSRYQVNAKSPKQRITHEILLRKIIELEPDIINEYYHMLKCIDLNELSKKLKSIDEKYYRTDENINKSMVITSIINYLKNRIVCICSIIDSKGDK